ncbi:hypothetical protein [Jidongwangia harbinensis]|uniref:hypothetical protein n=1 Tax=Jidongwangia harbinensis TaxID=2878561 RepID=UPI001CD9D603|nr:hypothetical protein [Jidongwangia harbinensis]MCA2216113.1 hypothetical protein [Jidongwangia harbinensis]
MSQPPYPPDPYSGQPGSEPQPPPGAGQPPPDQGGSHPPPGQSGYPPPGQGSYPPPGQGSYPPPEQGSYPPPGQGSYPPPGQGSYPPPGQGSYPPPGQGSYPPPGQGGYSAPGAGESASPPGQGGYPAPGAGGFGPPPGQGGYPAPGAAGFGPPPGQGGYPAPGMPQYGDPQSGAPKKKSSALKIVLSVVAVIAVLCIGGVAVTFFLAKDEVAKVVDASRITVVEPETLGGRPKITDPTVAGSVSSLDSQLSKVPGATESVGAVYGDVQAQDLVMIAAASSVTGSPQERFDEFTSGMTSGTMRVSNLTDTDPGPFGGIAKCGDTKSSGVEMAVCVWSDNGSIGLITMLFKGRADLEKEFIGMRGQIERKS